MHSVLSRPDRSGFIRRVGILWAAASLLVAGSAAAHDDLSVASDEFDSPASTNRWRSLWRTEGWGADQLAVREADVSEPGRLVLVPYASTWYQDWRGVLEYQDITGDFVVTTDVEPRRRSGSGAPRSLFSLAGIMARAPRPEVTAPDRWSPGRENYVFLSLGSGDSPGQFQFEVKTTRNSDSVLHLSPGTPRARIQVARLGSVFVFLRQSDAGPWIVHQRYVRPDLPATLQVGLTTYTDWNSASRLQPLVHNQTVIRDGNPDLVAVFDYVRFARPSIPETLRGRDFADPASVSDAELVAFLGPRANLPGGAIHPPGLTVGRGEPVGKIELRVGNLRSERSYRIEASEVRNDWLTVETFVADGESRSFVVDTGHGRRFFRVASP